MTSACMPCGETFEQSHEIANANVIVAAGWAAACANDIRGHGRSPGQRGYIDRFSIYRPLANAFVSISRQANHERLPGVLDA